MVVMTTRRTLGNKKIPSLVLLLLGAALLLVARTQLSIEDLHLATRSAGQYARVIVGVFGFFIGLALVLLGARRAVSGRNSD
jgi:protein-S-isoprenylcysteine O-methyltransferase Ste14